MRVPSMDVLTTGIAPPNSVSKVLNNAKSSSEIAYRSNQSNRKGDYCLFCSLKHKIQKHDQETGKKKKTCRNSQSHQLPPSSKH